MAMPTRQMQTIYQGQQYSTAIPSEPHVAIPFSGKVSLSFHRINPDIIQLQTENFSQYAPGFHIDIFDNSITITSTHYFNNFHPNNQGRLHAQTKQSYIWSCTHNYILF